MQTERLTTLAAVKEWLGIPTDTDVSDKGLVRVINAASQFILGYLGRDGFAPATYTDNFRGNGKNTTLLRNWPVLSVTSVGVGQSTFTAGSFGNGAPNGYILSDPRQSNQSIDLFGGHFYYRMPCSIVYRAGYENTESVEVASHEEGDPAVDVVDPWTPQQQQWVAGISVFNGSTELTQVTGDDAPLSGEYKIDEWGIYTFSLDDVGVLLTVEYGYVPWDVSFAVQEIIGEWYRRKEHIGLLSKTLGGQETVTFSSRDISEVSSTALQPYKNVVPI